MAEVGSAFVSVVPSARNFGRSLDSQVSGDLDSSGKRMGSRFGSALKVGALAALGGAVVVGKFLGDAVSDARESEAIGRRTENVIKRMGGASNVSAKQVADLATSISNKTGVDDEAIQSGQNLLLTFGKIRNEQGKGNAIFDRTTQLMTDMSAAMGTDSKSSAIQLGKALNDPVKGLTALSRVGVSFTAQQEKQIKSLVKHGDTLGAQKVILGEVEKQFGGAAKAMSSPADRAKVAWGNVKEQIGSALIPVVDKLLNLFLDAMPTITKAIEGVGPAFRRVKDLAQPVIDVVKRVFDAFKGGGGGSAEIRNLQKTFQSVFRSVKNIVRDAVEIVRAIWHHFGDDIVKYARNAFKILMGIVRSAFKVIRGIFKTVSAFIKGDWDGVWDGIKMIVRGAWGVVKGIIRAGMNAAKTLLSIGGGILKGIWNRLWDGIKILLGKAWDGIKSGVSRGVDSVVDFVKSIPGKVKSALGNLGNTLLNAGEELIQGLINGITNKLSALGDKMKEVADKVKGFLPGSPVKEGPLRSWNDGSPGRLLVSQGIIAGIDAERTNLHDSMYRLTSGVATGRPALSGVGTAGSAGGGRTRMTLVVGGREFDAYLTETADARVHARLRHDKRMATSG